MIEENKNEVSTEMEVNPESTKVELSEEEMDEINGGGVNLGVFLGGNERRDHSHRRNNNNGGKPKKPKLMEEAKPKLTPEEFAAAATNQASKWENAWANSVFKKP